MPVFLVSQSIRLMLVWLLLGMLPLAAEEKLLQLEILENKGEPLPNDRTTCLLRDQFGFLWMGTQRGLIRNHFSGFRWYRPNPSDSNALISGDIQALLEDAAGRFWVGTNGGLHLMDRRQGQFTRIQAVLANGEPWPSNNISVLMSDYLGNLWIGTDKGLLKLKDNEVHKVGDAVGLPDFWVSTIVEDEAKRLWVATHGNGLFLYESNASNRWQKVAHHWPESILTLHRTGEGIWWIGTDQGLYKSERDPLPGDVETVLEKVLAVPVNSLAEDGSGSIWAGQPQDLKRIAPNGQMEQVPIKGPAETQQKVRVQTIYADPLGMVWVSVLKGGVYFWDSYRENWWYERFNGAEIWALEEDGKGGVWVGTKYRGLLHYGSDLDFLSGFLSSEVIRSLHLDKENQLWIGTEKGLFRKKSMMEDPKKLGQPFQQRIWRIVRDEQDRLWLGLDSGLWYTDAIQPLTKNRVPWLEAYPGLNKAVITTLVVDADDLWVATYSHGLYQIDLQKQQVRHFDRHSVPALPSDEIVDVFVDRMQRVWVCSVSGGLTCLNPVGQLQALETSHGFRDQAVISICQDKVGALWANASSGVIQLSEDGERTTTYSKKDGVLLGSAIPGSKLMTEKALWFGGTEGVVRLEPDDLPAPRISSQLVTSVRKDGEEASQLMLGNESISIGENVGSFSLNLAQLDPHPYERGPWFYRRASKKEPWIEIQDDILQLGRYLPWGGNDQIQLKGSDHHGRPTQMQLEVRFLPPWWRAWLPFWLLAAIVLIISVTYLLASFAERRRRRALISKAQEALARQKLAEDRAAIAEKERAFEIRARHQHEMHLNVLQQHLEKVSTEMANDLHDGPLSEMRGLRFHLSHIKKNIADTQAAQRLRDLNDTLLPRITHSLRKVCGELLLPSFESGLVAEMEKYVDHLRTQVRAMTMTTHWDFEESKWDRKEKGTLYRIFRTLVKNVDDHAQAQNLHIELVDNDQGTTLKIMDDGKGFCVTDSYDALREKKHFGLYMAQFFARALGGTLHISEAPVKGTLATLKVPPKSNSTEVEYSGENW